ncbi:MAG: APC family permease, partial [Anaerovoracaceae bacterium]
MKDGKKEQGTVEQFGYKQELKRTMSLRDVVLYGVLFMVIIAPQSIFGEIQLASGGMTPLVYIVGFVAISFTAMSYMRMSNRFPIAGSVYAYVQRGIHPHVGFIAGWLILLDYIFVPSLLYVMVANWGVTLIPGSPWYVWILVFVLFNTVVNIRGMEMTKGVDWIMFVMEVA